MTSNWLHHLPTIGEVFDSGECQQELYGNGLGTKSANANAAPDAMQSEQHDPFEQKNASSSHEPMQVDDTGPTEVSARPSVQLYSDRQDCPFWNELARVSDPNQVPDFDPELAAYLEAIRNEPEQTPEELAVFQTVLVEFPMPPPRVSVPEDAARGFWTFSDEEGRIVNGRNSWIPPIWEEDPDYIRFTRAMPPSHTDFYEPHVCTPKSPNLAPVPWEAPAALHTDNLRAPSVTGISTETAHPSSAMQIDNDLARANTMTSPTADNPSSPIHTDRLEDTVMAEGTAPLPPSTPAQTINLAATPVSSSGPVSPPGDAVQTGDTVVLVESMKLNNQNASHSLIFDLDATAEAYAEETRIPTRHLPARYLVQGRSAQYYKDRRISFGLQRILTAEGLQSLAVQKGSYVPYATDEAVTEYMRWYQQRPAHPLESFSPPANVDIRLLGNIALTATEIITFFPNHIRWLEAGYRFRNNDWTTNELVAYLNYARQLDGDRAEKVHKYRSICLQAHKQMETPGDVLPDLLTPEHWTFLSELRSSKLTPVDYYIVDLAEGVVHMPFGEGAWILTRTVAYAIEHGYRYVKLSQIHDFIREHNIQPPLNPTMAHEIQNHGISYRVDHATRMALKRAKPEGLPF